MSPDAAPAQSGGAQTGGAHSGGAHSGGARAVIAALAANLGIAAAKFVAFAITGSASLLAESVHSVADSLNQLLLLIGRNRASRDETDEHQFGFGAERYFYAFIVAVVIFTVGALFSVAEGIERVLHPAMVTSPAVALAVLGIAFTLESLSFRTAVIESRPLRGEHGWRSFIRHAKAPELPAVVLEDFAALIGLSLALGGVIAATVTHNDRWDAAGSIAIGVLLGAVATVLAVEMKSLLIGESARPETHAAIVAAIADGPEVERPIHLRTLYIGPDTLLVAAKIAVRHVDTADSIAAGIDAVERRIRAVLPGNVSGMIFLEPDLFQASRLDPEDPAVRAASPPSAAGDAPDRP